ncbi:hypothetical protein C1645_814104 [Glomus cerebriforme]|uniref:Serine-threonine/tyrosine-protein kinase catalytic domain-containing protein n=1 Tax=Glomus cerebriforme TaxID=658196 RepID=A0A397TH39_9GLOM|nr:hypothetical protein C1645_814104 [Glomus cerebriforme]
MNKCWDAEPLNRPTIDKIIQELICFDKNDRYKSSQSEVLDCCILNQTEGSVCASENNDKTINSSNEIANDQVLINDNSECFDCIINSNDSTSCEEKH